MSNLNLEIFSPHIMKHSIWFQGSDSSADVSMEYCDSAQKQSLVQLIPCLFSLVLKLQIMQWRYNEAIYTQELNTLN
jgi:hypothetical protein